MLGPVQITGFADGTFVNIEYNADLWTLQMGADGEGVRSKMNDLSAKITLTLMSSSLGNAALMAALAAGLAGGAGSALPLIISDGATLTTHSAEGAWVQKVPAKAYAKEHTPVEWVLETNRLIPVMGTSIETP